MQKNFPPEIITVKVQNSRKTSVFQRLGGKGASAVSADNVDSDMLEKRRDELKRQLKLGKQQQLKCRHKSSSSSDSSSGGGSDSDSSSGSSSSTSSPTVTAARRNARKLRKPHRRSSSSGEVVLPVKKAKVSSKAAAGASKSSARKTHHKSHKAVRRASLTPPPRRPVTSTSPSSSSRIHHRSSAAAAASKTRHSASVDRKQEAKASRSSDAHHHHHHHHRHQSVREPEARVPSDRDRGRERDRSGHERMRSRSPMPPSSRHLSSPSMRSRDLKRKASPLEKRHSTRSPSNRMRVSASGAGSRRNERSSVDRERERRDKERQEREVARNKERAEALARCQERQRERERLAKEQERLRHKEREKSFEKVRPSPREMSHDSRRRSTSRTRYERRSPVERGPSYESYEQPASHHHQSHHRSESLTYRDRHHREERSVPAYEKEYPRSSGRGSHERSPGVHQPPLPQSSSTYEDLRGIHHEDKYRNKASYDDFGDTPHHHQHSHHHHHHLPSSHSMHRRRSVEPRPYPEATRSSRGGTTAADWDDQEHSSASRLMDRRDPEEHKPSWESPSMGHPKMGRVSGGHHYGETEMWPERGSGKPSGGGGVGVNKWDSSSYGSVPSSGGGGPNQHTVTPSNRSWPREPKESGGSSSGWSKNPNYMTPNEGDSWSDMGRTATATAPVHHHGGGHHAGGGGAVAQHSSPHTPYSGTPTHHPHHHHHQQPPHHTPRGMGPQQPPPVGVGGNMTTPRRWNEWHMKPRFGSGKKEDYYRVSGGGGGGVAGGPPVVYGQQQHDAGSDETTFKYHGHPRRSFGGDYQGPRNQQQQQGPRFGAPQPATASPNVGRTEEVTVGGGGSVVAAAASSSTATPTAVATTTATTTSDPLVANKQEEQIGTPTEDEKKHPVDGKEGVEGANEILADDGDNLSEISDDADDILDKEPPLVATTTVEERVGVGEETQNTTAEATTVEPVKAVEGDEVAGADEDVKKGAAAEAVKEEKETPNGEGVDHLASDDAAALDFEEISDGELEEEAAKVKGLGDALGVDWASLVAESRASTVVEQKARSTKSSVKEMWDPKKILLDVGVSVKMAGIEFAEKLLAKVDAAKPKEPTIKTEPMDDDDDEGQVEGAVKMEKVKSEQEAKEENDGPVVDLLKYPVACTQVALRRKWRARKELILKEGGAGVGRNPGALCARQDLFIRRQLCGLPRTEMACERTPEDTEQAAELARMAIELYRKATASAGVPGQGLSIPPPPPLQI